MSISDIISRIRGRDDRYEELAAQDRAVTKLENRKMSHNEVALKKIQMREREVAIKHALQNYARRQDKEFWNDKTVMGQPNMFRHQKNMFKPHSSKNTLPGVKRK